MVHTNRHGALLWLATVVLITMNLRPFLTAIGPLGPAIQSQAGIGLGAMAWLTLLPMALMGVGTWIAPSVWNRLGAQRAIAIALLLVVLGCLLRLMATDAATLIATAAVCGSGVALVQGILPGLIKQRTPKHVAPMMGVYSAALMGGGALGAQFSPLALQWGMGWQAALGLWAAPALLAMALAWYALRQSDASDGSPQAAMDTRWLLHRPRAWLLISCFGLVNGGYASMVAWLAPYYQEMGWNAADSGWLVAILSVAQAIAALSLPILARRQINRRPWLWLTLASQAAGFAMLAGWPLAAPALAVIILGAGMGGFFALIMVVALDHLPHPIEAGALNALMQGGGYILAALAPWVVAQLHYATGSFAAGWLAQFCTVLVASVLVARLAPQHYARVMNAPGPQETIRSPEALTPQRSAE